MNRIKTRRITANVREIGFIDKKDLREEVDPIVKTTKLEK
jgi:hypothetical protein